MANNYQQNCLQKKMHGIFLRMYRVRTPGWRTMRYVGKMCKYHQPQKSGKNNTSAEKAAAATATTTTRTTTPTTSRVAEAAAIATAYLSAAEKGHLETRLDASRSSREVGRESLSQEFHLRKPPAGPDQVYLRHILSVAVGLAPVLRSFARTRRRANVVQKTRRARHCKKEERLCEDVAVCMRSAHRCLCSISRQRDHRRRRSAGFSDTYDSVAGWAPKIGREGANCSTQTYAQAWRDEHAFEKITSDRLAQ